MRSSSASVRKFVRVACASGAALFLIALLPDAVAACPVCFDARDENRQAFIATTAFMSLLPLGMVAGAGLWIRKRHRDLDELYEGRPDTEQPERDA